jgi:hypothetical protein
MIRLNYLVTLVSDAEPGSGLGTELIDACVTADSLGNPVIQRSHIKGLMRERLRDILTCLPQSRSYALALVDECFGRAGISSDDGAVSRVRFLTDAAESRNESPRTITIVRTAVGELGTIRASSLRVVEAIPTTTRLEGSIEIDTVPGSRVDLAVRLALTSIEAIGAGRTRGSGSVSIEIVNDPRTPGSLLRELMAPAIASRSITERAPVARPARAVHFEQSPATWLRLGFSTNSPVCCPETPIVGINVIRSGFAIPASAVQGAIPDLLDKRDSALASACFGDDRFRAWPLLPASLHGSEEGDHWPVRVSLSHRVSKLPLPTGKHEFKDAAIQPYDWREIAAGSPLKAADGVLLRDRDARVRLWRAADMPRHLSAHGVHRDGDEERNLFTVEAMAPMNWAGMVSMPVEAASELCRILSERVTVAFGKARSIRGTGLLTVQALHPNHLQTSHRDDRLNDRVFIVQSPLVIPDKWPNAAANDLFAQLLTGAGWGAVDFVRASAGIRFGWNRRGLGQRVGQHNRLRARRCILPGSIVVLAQKADDLIERLVRGVGEGRDAGFGALLPHPGMAEELYLVRSAPQRRNSRDAAGRFGLQLWRKVEGRGPSRSQIAAVMGRLRQSPSETLAYLARQETGSERRWRCWRPVIADVRQLIERESPETALAAIRVWHDLAVPQTENGDQQ